MLTEQKRLHVLLSKEQMEWLNKKATSFTSKGSIVRALINRAMENDP